MLSIVRQGIHLAICPSRKQELTDTAFLNPIPSFSGRLYGMRSYQQRELLTCAHVVINKPNNY
jgi:predicted site-specific integrase-resolvase